MAEGQKGWIGGAGAPLTLVDTLERTHPTEFHADPEPLQPTTVREQSQ